MKHPLVGLYGLCIALTISSCDIEEPPLPPNSLQFESTEMGFEEAATSKTIRLQLARAAETSGQIILNITAQELVYGTQFTTQPNAENGRILVPVQAGQSDITVTINRTAGFFFTGQESIQLQISPESSFPIGTNPSLSVRFGAIVSTGQTIQLNGGSGGSNAVNAVFLHLASNMQTPVARSSWDLRLANDARFQVFLNNMTAATALVTNQTDLSQVSPADTMGRNMALTMTAGQMNLVDDVTGAFSRSVIPIVSAIESENKVVILQRGTGGATPRTDLLKVRVIRQGNGYRIFYARLDEATFRTMDVPKTTSGQPFQFVSLPANAIVPVEPPRWDIAWGGFIYQTRLATGEAIPYYFSDLVFTNARAGVQVAQVATSSVSFADFNATHVAGLTFSAEPDAIGSSWRVTFGGTVGVRTDRFYVIRTQGGSIYKLRFVNFTSADGGERGRPTILYQLVQK